MSTSEYAGNRLQKLTRSDYEIADGEPDIRGWDVRNSGDQLIGKVKELIFDVQSLKVRYMVVKPDKDFTNSNTDEVLVPIGLAELDKTDDDAVLPGVTAEQLNALPEYNDDITQDDEVQIRNVFAGLGVAGLGAAAYGNPEGETDFYNHAHFNEDNLFKNRKGQAEESASIPVIEEELQVGKKTVQTGGAYIKSRIVEKPVEAKVNLQEEHVTVERTSVDRPVSSTDMDAFKDGMIEMQERAEVPVVSKEARVVEEITISKEVSERNETVRDTVRKTEVDVENIEGSNDAKRFSANTPEE